MVKSNKADPAFYYNAQSRRASLRRASSITRNPPRIQLLRCNLPLLLSGEGGGNKVPFILPTFEGRSASESEREEESLSLYLSPRSALKLISKRPPSNGRAGTQRARGHSTRKINKDRKGTNFSWMGYQYEGGCIARSLRTYFRQNWPYSRAGHK